LETVGFGEPTGNLRDFTLYNVGSKRRSCPARCASGANVISRDAGIWEGKTVSLNDLLKLFMLIIGPSDLVIAGSNPDDGMPVRLCFYFCV